ncbi:hypothetical protein GCM10010967_19040 [Dyadobacter beijingensis]|uniref:Uncharacterized protein n=1 Tax=Dyadobacter beijingensis TaxID=365489 RepID=A0ABQ2HSE4_9BACT|nr:hypothetical protein [Dyadobacter beijingensis]GGM86859.1 hypothetical protein GCM10010967_19040 [Dyadobacter beijingensis]
MKTVITFIIAFALGVPAYVQAQSRSTRSESTRQERVYQRKTQKHQVKTADSSDLNAILKDSANAETGPILNDNGNVNSSGTIDGSRSSTGRPDADTTTYTVRRKKTVIRSGYTTPRDTTKRKRP